jgi:hypothetical protein
LHGYRGKWRACGLMAEMLASAGKNCLWLGKMCFWRGFEEAAG